MDVSGLIFAVLALACLFYIVPRRLSWRIPTQEQIDQQNPLHLSMKTVHSGVPRDQTTETAVSTLLMRRAGQRNARRLARRAEKWRRGVFVVLLAVCLATVPFAVLGWGLRWWVPLAVFGVVVAWAVFSHIEARVVRRQLDAIVADLELGDDERTILVQLQPAFEPTANPTAIVGPNGDVQTSLWDPITVAPVTTYISSPPKKGWRIRTIDIGGPVPKLPVTDDWPETGQAAVG